MGERMYVIEKLLISSHLYGNKSARDWRRFWEIRESIEIYDICSIICIWLGGNKKYFGYLP
jgi:hypothetical protein